MNPSKWAQAWAGFAMYMRYIGGRGDGRAMGQSTRSVYKFEALEIARRAAEHD